MALDDSGAAMNPDSSLTSVDIERICEERSELQHPPQAFLISATSLQNSLLAVRTDFLDNGEGLPWPGLPLLGATFDLDWGYASVDLISRANRPYRFEQAACRLEDSAIGDTWGYRFCPLEHSEITKTLDELAQVRKRLSEPRIGSSREVACQIIVSDL